MPAPEYNGGVAPVDAGLIVYDMNGNLVQPRWTTFLLGLEYYVPAVGGRLGIFANFSRSALADAASYPNPKKVRDHEHFFDAGLFVDVGDALRFAADAAHIDDYYADGIKAANEAVQVSGWFFF
jgi:hypothetical protein